MCCHSTEINPNANAVIRAANAACETGRDGNDLTSTADPESLTSSCHPGNVDRRMNATKQIAIARYLLVAVCQHIVSRGDEGELRLA